MKKIILFILLSGISNKSLFAQWNKVSLPLSVRIIKIQFTNDTVGYIIGNISNQNGIVFKTTNSGNNWDTILKTNYPLGDISFINQNTGYLFSGNQLLKTTNGGLTWSVKPCPNADLMQFVNDSTGFLIEGNNPTYYCHKTTDSGNTWVSFTKSHHCLVTTGVHFFNEQKGLITGWYGPTFTQTINGGQNWNNINPGVSAGESYYGLSCPSSTTWYVVSLASNNQTNYLLKTTDGGITWMSNPFPSPYDLNRYRVPVSCPDTNTCYIVNGDGMLYKTINSGVNWIPQNIILGDIYCVNKNLFFGVRDSLLPDSNTYVSALFRTQNAGGIVGIEDVRNEEVQKLTCYPNPFTSTTTIEYFIRDEVQKAQIKVFDILGKEVRSADVSNTKGKGSITIDRKGLETGVYFYGLVIDGRTIEQQKVIITK